MAGYIKLHRGWRDTDGIAISTVYSEAEAWLWLLENAAWKPTNRFTAKGEIVAIERGQMHVSLASLSSAWGWSKKRVRTFLDRLETVSKVGTAKAQSGTVISITNYDTYQGEGHSRGTEEGTAGAQPGHTQEEGKERKEEKNMAYAFAGRVIRLNQRDFDQWREAFHRIPDIRAELTSLDIWLSGEPEARRKKWFNVVSGALNKKHQTAAAPTKEAEWEFSSPC